ncbi:MAG: VCBS repeat-containing protein [Planctomycetaceae bacterium]
MTSVAGIPTDIDYSHGCTACDIDNDGFADLFVTCYGQSRLLRNNGDGTFVDATRSMGLVLETWNTAAAFGDVDGDGCSDLYVAGYLDWKPDPNKVCQSKSERQDICSPQNYAPVTDHLFINSSDGEFRNETERFGIRSDGMGMG